MRLASNMIVPALVLLWILGIFGGTVVMMNYDYAAAPEGDHLIRFPKDATFGLAQGKMTLVMFANPDCPCSKASVQELAELLARTSYDLKVQVLFFKPGQFPESWARTDLFDRASALPHSTVAIDNGGVEAMKFHATTSGETFVFSPDGALKFRGGITRGRGQYGISPGILAVKDVLETGRTQVTGKTYGCTLFKTTKEVTP